MDIKKANHTVTMPYWGFSEEDIAQTIKDSPGKPVTNGKNKVLGTIEYAERVEDKKAIKFHIHIDEYGLGGA